MARHRWFRLRSSSLVGSERYGYRTGLAVAVLTAALLGLLGAATTVSVLKSTRMLCDGSACPDGITYLLPAMLGGVVFAAPTLAIGVFWLARRMDETVRAALAVDLARLAAVPMLALGSLALIWFALGGFLPMLGYGAALLLGGIGPVLAGRGGRRVFLTAVLGFASLAMLVAVPATLVAPLLAGYALVLVIAALVAFRSPSDLRPYGALPSRAAPGTTPA